MKTRDLIATKRDLQAIKVEMIKWIFIFWAGQITVNIALIILFLK